MPGIGEPLGLIAVLAVPTGQPDIELSYYSAGGISGNALGNVIGCTVENLTIGAYDESANFDASRCGTVVGCLEASDAVLYVTDNYVTSTAPMVAGQCGIYNNAELSVVGWGVVYDDDNKIVGGTFEKCAPVAIAAGYELISVTPATTPATFTVEEIGVAQIGTTKYATLAEAVAALNQTAGQTLTLLADAEITAPIVISKDAVIDLNGFTLTSSGCAITVNVGVGSLELQNGDIVGRAGAIVYGDASNASTVQGVITLDNVDISATGGDAIAMYAYKGSFVLDLNSTNTITATDSGCDGIYVDCYYYNETAISGSGALTVSGANGGIHLSYSIPMLNAPNLKASGGTVGGFKLDGTGSDGVVKGITAGMFSNDVTANCADGYVCISSGDATYGYKVVDGSAYNVMATVNGSTAVYDTIAEAITAAGTETVRIIVNNSLEENINVGAGQTVVIDAGAATIDGTIASAGTLVILNGDFTSDPTPWIDDGKEVGEGSGVFTVQTRDLESGKRRGLPPSYA